MDACLQFLPFALCIVEVSSWAVACKEHRARQPNQIRTHFVVAKTVIESRQMLYSGDANKLGKHGQIRKRPSSVMPSHKISSLLSKNAQGCELFTPSKNMNA